MRAIHLKSFDYRVLNLLLYKLRGEEVSTKQTPLLVSQWIWILYLMIHICLFLSFFGTLVEKVNELHMDFLSISEFLVEVADDLYASF